MPKEVQNYFIELPITLKGYGKLESLRRNILSKCIKPKFLLEPQTIEFKKRVINAYDNKGMSSSIDIEISNPDQKLVSWRLDTKAIEEDHVFIVKPLHGKLEPGQKAILKAYFQPINPGEYEKNIPLFLDDSNKSYMEVKFKGEGAYPRLTFDRREVILPVAPLDVEARCSFRIINDGYENLTLKYKLSADSTAIAIELHFPEGLNLGITKNK